MKYILFLLIPILSFGQGGMYKASYQQGNTATRGAWDDASLVAYWDADDLTEGDGANVTTWTDNVSSFDFIAPGGNEPVVNVRGDLTKELVFTSANSDYMNAPSDYAAIDWVGTDDATIIIWFGTAEPQFSQSIIHKGAFSANQQFALQTNSSGTNMGYGVGGTSSNLATARDDVSDGFFVIRWDTNGKDAIIDNITIETNDPTGTTYNIETWQIGARANTSSQPADVAFRKIAFYNSYLSDAKLTEIWNGL